MHKVTADTFPEALWQLITNNQLSLVVLLQYCYTVHLYIYISVFVFLVALGVYVICGNGIWQKKIWHTHSCPLQNSLYDSLSARFCAVVSHDTLHAHVYHEDAQGSSRTYSDVKTTDIFSLLCVPLKARKYLARTWPKEQGVNTHTHRALLHTLCQTHAGSISIFEAAEENTFREHKVY